VEDDLDHLGKKDNSRVRAFYHDVNTSFIRAS